MSRITVHQLAAPAILATLALAAPAAAQEPAATVDTITVTGTGQVKPKPRDARSEASIAKAVRVAHKAATPLAITNGQARAQELAALAGLTLGPLVALTEGGAATPFGFYSPFGQEGTFGPDRYCGTVRRSHLVTKNGKRRRVFTSKHACRVPQQVVETLTLTYSTTSA